MMSSWRLKITEHRRHSLRCQDDHTNKHTALPLSDDGLLSVVPSKRRSRTLRYVGDEKPRKNEGFFRRWRWKRCWNGIESERLPLFLDIMTPSCYKYHSEYFIQHRDCNKQLLSVNGITAIWLTFTFFFSSYFCSELQHSLSIFSRKHLHWATLSFFPFHSRSLRRSFPVWLVLPQDKQRCWSHYWRPLDVYLVNL